MVVTELSLLRLKKGGPLSANPELKLKLHSAIRAQAACAKSAVWLLNQRENPDYIYLIGKWDSVSEHMDEWVPGDTNQEIMHSLKDDIELGWVQHIDMDGWRSGEDEKLPFPMPATAIARYFVAPADKEAFEKTFQEKKVYLKNYLKNFPNPRSMVGGWRLDPEVDEQGNPQEEFVLFSGWGAREEHLAFAETEEFKEFSKIKDFMKDAEIRHAKWIDAS